MEEKTIMLLTVENLTKVYIKKKILNNVSFSIKKGE
ncbi:peptide ABC transporter ATP-binding protein, partial [Fusobacterium nucleatum]